MSFNLSTISLEATLSEDMESTITLQTLLFTLHNILNNALLYCGSIVAGDLIKVLCIIKDSPCSGSAGLDVADW